MTAQPRDFLAVATPGSGKTTFALRIAGELLADGTVERITVVVPTEHLKTQWALAAAPGRHRARSRSSATPPAQNSVEYHGVVVTYAQVASHPDAAPGAHREPQDARRVRRDPPRRRRQELGRRHPRGVRRRDAPAGADRHAVPQRRQRHPVRHLRAATRDGLLRSQADHTYGYAEALADGVVRPVVFLAYSGEARWRDSAGEEHAARLGEPLNAEQTARAWRTALNPAGEWMPAVIAAADTRLQQKRQHVPDAGGMIIASDQTAARAYADLLTKITGEAPTVVLSDDPGSSDRIAEFSRGHQPLAGRGADGVRGRRRAPAGGRRLRHQRVDAAVLRPGDRPLRAVAAARRDREHLPAVGAHLLQLASEMEAQRNHVLGKPHREAEGCDDEALADAASRSPSPTRWTTASRCSAPTPNSTRSSSTARRSARRRRRAATRRPTTSASPACWTPTQMRDLLRRRQEEQTRPSGPRAGGTVAACHRHHARAAARAAQASSTRWCRSPTTAPASRTAGSTTSCAGSAAGRRGGGEHRSARGPHRGGARAADLDAPRRARRDAAASCPDATRRTAGTGCASRCCGGTADQS